MAVMDVEAAEFWYKSYRELPGDRLQFETTDASADVVRQLQDAKNFMGSVTKGFENLQKHIDAEVVTERKDLPNVSSGDTAGLLRRMARNIVQNTPNVEINSVFDDDGMRGIVLDYLLRKHIVQVDSYSNDMQQKLMASTLRAECFGFDCVIPTLIRGADGEYNVMYESIHYSDVFPETGVSDVRTANEVFIRRYLTKADVKRLIRTRPPGWRIAELKQLLRRPTFSVDEESRKRTKGYEIITWYTNSGDDFLTFHPETMMLLRVEQNRHPKKEHPVFFLILELDARLPFGKSQAALIYGKQEFQDLSLNGAFKLMYLNLTPTIMAYGLTGSTIDMSPGKLNPIPNPNARIQAFEVNPQTLSMFNSISQNLLGSMVNTTGSADQQMASQAGHGMSQTPQGVEAQQAVVDITTNAYQKAVELFFSKYCSYALTMYVHELQSMKRFRPDAKTRAQLLKQGLDPKLVDDKGVVEFHFSALKDSYHVVTIPGSIAEIEDEKQLRILNQLHVTISQALNAVAATEDLEMVRRMNETIALIIQRIIELSSAADRDRLAAIFSGGEGSPAAERLALAEQRNTEIDDYAVTASEQVDSLTSLVAMQAEQMAALRETQAIILQHLGVETAPVAGEMPAETGAAMDVAG